jgi:hypothetical protein
MRSHLCSSSIDPKKLLVLSINGVLCYFPPLVVLERNARVFGKNVNNTKMEVRARMENFLNKTFQKFHIVIWSCKKLEDVLEILPMLMLESFLGWFVFFWGREQCSKTSNFTWVSLLLKGFEMCLLCLLWERLWKGGINIVN